MVRAEDAVSRRDFVRIGTAAATTAALYAAAPVLAKDRKGGGRIVMPKLPYAPNALAPHISAKTVKLHYHDHHKAYYDLVTGYLRRAVSQYAPYELEEIIARTKDGINEEESLHFMAILLYNHNLYWPGMKPGGGGKPGGRLGRRIDKSFGSYDAFRKELLEKAMAIGSGWVTLARSGEALLLTRSDYHDTPILKNQEMLLTLDVWEHAYYLDYLSDRQKYVDAWLDHLVNWEYAEARLKQF